MLFMINDSINFNFYECMKLANEHTAKSVPVVRTPCFVSVVHNQLAIKTYDQCFSAQTY